LNAAQPLTLPTVLIVEDEMMLRMRAVNIVEEAGFTPIEAVSADEALAILEARSDISLLFTDIQMPGSMDGLKLAFAVRERWPDINIILVSGQVTLSDAEKPPESRFFGKPLVAEQIIAQLQEMIGRTSLGLIPIDLAALSTQPLERELDARLKAARVVNHRASPQEFLTAENDSLRLLLLQAGIDAKQLLAQAGIEAKERETADKLQKLILDEMHHRIKNTLATVSAIASQSLRVATSIEHAQHAIEGRLLALGRAHDLLMQASWASANLADIIKGATEPYDVEGAGKFSIEGPDLKITSGAVIALAMTLNELCTNTTKFGALSVPSGRVAICWELDVGEQRLHLTWTEKMGPPVHVPTFRSFGTRLMQTLGKQLNGEVELGYEPAGLIYALDVPLSALVPPTAVAPVAAVAAVMDNVAVASAS
jgi:two-component sensor histidine kinase/ActR/RegA family two-component response regulator